MTRAARWGSVARWLAAVVLSAVAFEVLDAVAGRTSMVSWTTLLSPVVSGGIAAWLAGGGVRSRLLASAATPWARIGADRAIGLAHGVRQPLEVEAAVAALFGIPWMVLAVVGGLLVVLARPRLRPQNPRRRYGSSPRVT